MRASYLEAQTMMEWRLTPSEWDQISADDKAFMMATLRVNRGMEAWEAEIHRINASH